MRAALLLFLAGTAGAHAFDPSLLELRAVGPDQWESQWRNPVGTLKTNCGDLSHPCRLETLTVEGLGERDVLLRVQFLDGRVVTSVLRRESPSFTVTGTPAAAAFIRLGIAHILGGFDHLLFVLGLVLLVRRLLLLTLTAFTIAHSLTLALAVLGMVTVPQAPVEVAIALSILCLAVELTRTSPGLTSRQPWLVAFAFGLLHGLGFAGALGEVGLPAGQVPQALFCFNLGVELGQIAFVGAVLLVRQFVALLRAKAPRLPLLARRAPAYVIGTLAVFWCLTLMGCSQAPPAYHDPRTPCAEHDPLRRAFFGELHSHTSYSFDAWTYGIRAKPADAYAFAKGGPAVLPAPAAGGNPITVQLERPLDFAAVTDHSEYLGETTLCTDPQSPAYASRTCEDYRGGMFIPLGAASQPPNPFRADFCGSDGATCKAAASPVWKDIIDAAEAAYDRSAECRFTSFIAYEYSLSPLGSNMHRNVIFRNARALPAPISFYEAPEPVDLWTQLKKQCLDGGQGCDVIAIPHNSNASNGLEFRVEYPNAVSVDDERGQARLRAQLEPLVEIFQHKGDSECINGLPEAAAAPDELCDAEKWQKQPLKDCGPDGTGSGGLGQLGCVSWRDFVRNALKLGLAEGLRLGVNPFKLGIIASTDTHSATPGNVDEADFTGATGNLDDSPAGALATNTTIGDRTLANPGGLAAAWAEENSRDALFDAFKRRETFGTSGPRITVRFFGGWSYDAALCGDAELVKKGYAGGVPMGGDLPRPAGSAPHFVVAALADETPLAKAQIIKGWVDATGALREQVYDVAASPGATVDPATCQRSQGGAMQLCAVWVDPDFDASRPAFYYARVVENPSCRWSTYMCNALSPAERTQLGCDNLPQTINERAWTSPIWY